MTNDDAIALHPGDHIRRMVEHRTAGQAERNGTLQVDYVTDDLRNPMIVTVEGYHFASWEVEQVHDESWWRQLLGLE